MFKKKKHSKNHKFCPVCGEKLNIDDAYCLKCGYSFAKRKKKKRIKWKNIIITIVIIILVYIGLRFFGNKTIIPSSLGDLLNFSTSGK